MPVMKAFQRYTSRVPGGDGGVYGLAEPDPSTKNPNEYAGCEYPSAGWPSERSAAEEVEVDMKDGLSGLLSGVVDDAIAMVG